MPKLMISLAAAVAIAQAAPAQVAASEAVAEKSGLHLVWRGPDAGNPDRTATRGRAEKAVLGLLASA